MWPFRNSPKEAAPEHTWGDGTVARYNSRLNFWSFSHDKIEFTLSRVAIDPAALDYAKEILALIRTMDADLKGRVEQELGDWPCDKSKAHIAVVDLSEYAKLRKFDAEFFGDESWGDFSITIIVAEGKITDAYGGD